MPGTASADWAPVNPADPATPATVTADALPTVQINGVAWTQVVVGNTVFVGGDFSTARPAGAAPGVAETPRSNLLAYDIRTGELITSFAPALDGQVLALAASPDGSRLYVGGDFGRVNGQVRSRIAAFNAATGELVTDFRPAVSGQVSAIAATNATVYFGGTVTAVGSVARTRLAAVSAATGALTAWAPQPGGTSNQILAITLAGTNQVVVGGRFASLNGTATSGVGALDATTGATRPFAVGQRITNQGPDAAIYSLTTSNGVVYGTGYDFGGPGNLEDTFAARADGGQAVWFSDCRGDHYSVHATSTVVYTASHAHDCANIGSFPEQQPRVHMFANALSAAATGTVQRISDLRGGNTNLVGQPAPSYLPWDPDFIAGTYTGQFQAGWSVTGNGDYVVYGGEFPTVNGVGQQGLVRFAVPALAPNRVGPATSRPFALTTTMVPGAVRLTWPSVTDRDNENLTYRVYRDSDTSAPVCEATRPTRWWDLPAFGCVDTSASAGSHRWLVTVSDPAGNRLSSAWVTATVPAASSGASRPYARAVAADGALDHWWLGEGSGGIAYDYAGTRDLTVGGGVTRGAAGAIPGDTNTASTFNGTSSGTASTGTAVAGPQTFSVEAWFQTTSTAGGKIIGFGDRTTGLSDNRDRHVWMDTSGRLSFAIWDGTAQTVTGSTAYNDGRWHHVVGTMTRSGLALYVDGTLVASKTGSMRAQAFNGYWRIGGDASWSGSPWFTGRIDEVAVYPSALSAQQVANHAALGRGQNLAPTAAFGTQVADLTARVDAGASTDPEGVIRSYAWDFGDGTTATGVTAARTYAAPGTYTVRLTVTDGGGLTATTTRSVTVTAPPTGAGSIAADTFGREVASGWGTAERGGVWTTSGSTSVSAGTGRLAGAAGQSASARLSGVSRTDVALQATLTMPQLATGGGTYVGLAAQSVGLSDYRVKLRYRSDGQVEVMLARTVDDVETILDGYQLPGGYAAGTALTVRFETSGGAPTTLRLKVWPAGTAEPAAWSLTRTDATASLQRPGAVSLDTYVSASATATSTLRVDDLRVEPAGTVTTPTPQPNQAPVAAFTATPSQLTVAVDGSGSTDDTGVTGYAWDFGDSATATGATASHTYAAAGTYTVRLTVTDAAGLTGTTTRTVTVTAPPAGPQPGAPIAADTFGREVASGWGTAEVGGAWTTSGTTSVTGGAAQLSGARGQSASARLAGVNRTDVVVQATLTVPQLTTGGGTYVSLATQQVGLTDYRAKLRFRADGQVEVMLMRTVNDEDTILGGYLLAGGYTAGTSLNVRLETSGTGTTTVQVKVWRAGTTQPTAWDLTRTDTTAALQRPGAVALDTYTSGSSTATATVRVDDLRVDPAGTTGTTPTPQPNQAPVAAFTATPSALTVAVDGSGSTDDTGVTGYAWDFGDSATATGATASHTYAAAGTYTVRLTVTDAAGATGTTTRSVTVAAAQPTNQAPVAAFTATPSALTVAVDGSGSTDDTGVTGYAWDFGDDGTATGATASHTYAAAGTYTVRLTVTDAAGLTGTTTRSVTVAAAQPQPGTQPLAADAFERQVTGGWGTADTGGPWAVAGPVANASVTGGAGQLSVPAGQTSSAALAQFSRQDVAVQVALTLPQAPTGGGAYVGLAARSVGLTDYRVKMRFRADGQVEVMLVRTVNDVDTILGGYLLPGGYRPGSSLTVRFEAAGTGTTTLRVKAWATGTAEPAAWALVRTDDAAVLQRAGTVLLDTYVSSSATAATAVRFDQLWVGEAGTAPAAP
ncbi:PKD repeat protein [Geodermatophilus normandii]|uniref:PKD repeat protein n=1 Tax=Geodermatophilus normandii TaxID=1137989 RepID=A0A317QGH5_9ACTN|nr:PKD repeat protein [Geodermatophilus normandii]